MDRSANADFCACNHSSRGNALNAGTPGLRSYRNLGAGSGSSATAPGHVQVAVTVVPEPRRAVR
ncbi:hypothetical protein F4560_007414 [Saccharothrix ecbatanensis]|uniref:Uncharacterized protein n=1 Tax=Saccharothrix ecbatanensis TaxID=1105145 RepID=A0A7W9HT01_9PSEU|nr:hypothetical protein [Saccharothrix ecbatanensis]